MDNNWNNDHDACGIGAVININGKPDNKVLDDALSIVEKLEHRAGKDATGKVGDGVGILTQISHAFFKKEAKKIGIELQNAGDYGIGMFFLPQDAMKRMFAMRMFKVIVEKEGMEFLGWRDVPTHPEILGEVAVECMPTICQCFIRRPDETPRPWPSDGKDSPGRDGRRAGACSAHRSRLRTDPGTRRFFQTQRRTAPDRSAAGRR